MTDFHNNEADNISSLSEEKSKLYAKAMAKYEGGVILYSTPGCPMCSTLKHLLDSKKIIYVDIEDVEVIKAAGLVHVPVLIVKNQSLNFKEALQWIRQQ